MINPALDGIEHINVYSKGKTLLGRLLSNFAHTPFDLADHGHFASVEGYWYWLGCRNEALRSCVGFEAKKIGRASRGADWNDTPDFKSCILRALAAKRAAHPRINALLIANTLPFEHYYVFGDKVYNEKAKAQWMLDFWSKQ
jgi:hypothetical protein